MPNIPLPPGTDNETYKKNTTDQYESLGRFVEAFERMVHEIRESIIALIARDTKHGRLVEVALHHSALTAKPLFDIFRALIIEIVEDAITADKKRKDGTYDDAYAPLVTDINDDPLHFTIAERGAFLGTMAELAAEFEHLSARRNELLHATWFVGYVDASDPNASMFYARKFKTTKTGLSPVDLPKNAGQLKELCERCEEATNWVAFLHACSCGTSEIQKLFQSHGGKWWLIWPNGSATTFPRKSS
jgi:hypothetical protein